MCATLHLLDRQQEQIKSVRIEHHVQISHNCRFLFFMGDSLTKQVTTLPIDQAILKVKNVIEVAGVLPERFNPLSVDKNLDHEAEPRLLCVIVDLDASMVSLEACRFSGSSSSSRELMPCCGLHSSHPTPQR